MVQQINFDVPSPETLAGIYVCVTGEEDLTVYPRKIEPIQIGRQADNGSAVDDNADSAKSADERRETR